MVNFMKAIETLKNGLGWIRGVVKTEERKNHVKENMKKEKLV